MEHPENNEAYKGLVVNAGIEQPSSVNPYLKRKVKKRQLSVNEFVEGIVKGDVTILSQAVTLVESVRPEHQATAQEVIEKCLPYSGNSIRVGISGVPGAGKSTSIDVFGLHVLEKGGKVVGLEVKSGAHADNEGMGVFAEKFQPDKVLLVGTGGIPYDELLKISPKEMF